MAKKLTVTVFGGEPKMDQEAATVAELKQSMGLSSHAASVNGEPASDDYELSDYEQVLFSPATKGGR